MARKTPWYPRWKPLMFAMAAGGVLGPQWARKARVEVSNWDAYCRMFGIPQRRYG